jgi:hypothetical protein
MKNLTRCDGSQVSGKKEEESDEEEQDDEKEEEDDGHEPGASAKKKKQQVSSLLFCGCFVKHASPAPPIPQLRCLLPKVRLLLVRRHLPAPFFHLASHRSQSCRQVISSTPVHHTPIPSSRPWIGHRGLRASSRWIQRKKKGVPAAYPAAMPCKSNRNPSSRTALLFRAHQVPRRSQGHRPRRNTTRATRRIIISSHRRRLLVPRVIPCNFKRRSRRQTIRMALRQWHFVPAQGSRCPFLYTRNNAVLLPCLASYHCDACRM